MASESRLELDLEAWAAEFADLRAGGGDPSQKLTSAGAVGAALGLSLVSMSFRADAGDASLAEAFRESRSQELDDLRAEVLQLAVTDGEMAGSSDVRQLEKGLDRAHEMLEVPLRGLRLALAGRPGIAPGWQESWDQGCRWLATAAETLAPAVRARTGHLEAALADSRRALAQALVQEARTALERALGGSAS